MHEPAPPSTERDHPNLTSLSASNEKLDDTGPPTTSPAAAESGNDSTQLGPEDSSTHDVLKNPVSLTPSVNTEEMMKIVFEKYLNDHPEVIENYLKSNTNSGPPTGSYFTSETNGPPPTNDRVQPADDGDSDQPADDGDSGQPADDGDSDQPADDGDSDQPADDGDSDQPADDGDSDQPADDGDSDQPADDGDSDQPADDGDSGQPADNGDSDQPADDGDSGHDDQDSRFTVSEDEEDDSEHFIFYLWGISLGMINITMETTITGVSTLILYLWHVQSLVDTVNPLDTQLCPG